MPYMDPMGWKSPFPWQISDPSNFQVAVRTAPSGLEFHPHEQNGPRFVGGVSGRSVEHLPGTLNHYLVGG